MFDWFARDIAGFLTAFALFPLAVVFPGALLFRAFLPSEWRETSAERRLGLSLLCGFAAWPVVLSLVGHAGPRAILGAAVIGCAAGLRELVRAMPRMKGSFRLTVAAVVLAVAGAAALFNLLPWLTEDGFRLSAVTFDGQKHVAVTRMIVETGIPPKNLLWTMEAPAEDLSALGYYFQFHTLLAAVLLLSGDLVEARHALHASMPWLLLAHYVLILEILRAVTGGSPAPKLRAAAAGALLFVGGYGIQSALTQGFWLTTNDQVLLFFGGTRWVPQHHAGGLSAVFGLMLLARGAGAVGLPDRARIGILAATALGNALASSVPVGVVAAATGVLWLATVALRRDIAAVRWAAAVGTGAALTALPVLVTLAATHGTAHGERGLVFALRNPPLFPEMSAPIFAPINTSLFYAVHFGILLLGAIVCLTAFRSRLRHSPEAMILAMAACAAIILATFVKSNVINNDFGWRAPIPAVIVLAVLTVIAVENAAAMNRALRALLLAAFCLGLFETGVHVVVELRPEEDNPSHRSPGFRGLWEEIDRRLPADAVVQLRPTLNPFVADHFYRIRGSAMGDVHHAVVYGRSTKEAFRRRDELDPLFSDTRLSFDEARRLARRFRIDFVAVENVDPVRNAPEAWPQTLRPVFETQQFRVYDVRE